MAHDVAEAVFIQPNWGSLGRLFTYWVSVLVLKGDKRAACGTAGP